MSKSSNWPFSEADVPFTKVESVAFNKRIFAKGISSSFVLITLPVILKV